MGERCPNCQGYTYDADLCLCMKYNESSILHDEAVTKCAADNGELVKIDSSSQQEKVESFLGMSYRYLLA